MRARPVVVHVDPSSPPLADPPPGGVAVGWWATEPPERRWAPRSGAWSCVVAPFDDAGAAVVATMVAELFGEVVDVSDPDGRLAEPGATIVGGAA